MIIPITKDLKTLCDRIVEIEFSGEAWVQRDPELLVEGSCTCIYDQETGVFSFKLSGIRDYTYDGELTFDEILGISSGCLEEIDITPMGGIHPEDAGMRRIEIDTDVLQCAINDAINIYVRDVLIPRGIVDPEKHENDTDLLLELKNKITQKVANRWAVSWEDDSA